MGAGTKTTACPVDHRIPCWRARRPAGPLARRRQRPPRAAIHLLTRARGNSCRSDLEPEPFEHETDGTGNANTVLRQLKIGRSAVRPRPWPPSEAAAQSRPGLRLPRRPSRSGDDAGAQRQRSTPAPRLEQPDVRGARPEVPALSGRVGSAGDVGRITVSAPRTTACQQPGPTSHQAERTVPACGREGARGRGDSRAHRSRPAGVAVVHEWSLARGRCQSPVHHVAGGHPGAQEEA